MGEKTKFKVNIKTGEIELEGDQKFVEGQINRLPELVYSITVGKSQTAEMEFERPEAESTMKKTSAGISTVKKDSDMQSVSLKKQRRKPKGKIANTDGDFLDWMKNYKPNLKQVDYVLLLGYYTQKRTSTDSFRTSDVSKLLKIINVKVSNITSTLYLLNRKKKLEITKKQGISSFFKVTVTGEKHLVTLLK